MTTISKKLHFPKVEIQGPWQWLRENGGSSHLLPRCLFSKPSLISDSSCLLICTLESSRLCPILCWFLPCAWMYRGQLQYLGSDPAPAIVVIWRMKWSERRFSDLSLHSLPPTNLSTRLSAWICSCFVKQIIFKRKMCIFTMPNISVPVSFKQQLN